MIKLHRLLAMISMSIAPSLTVAPLVAQYAKGNIHKPRQMTPNVPANMKWQNLMIGFSPNTGKLWNERSGRDIGEVTWTTTGNPVYTAKMTFTANRTHFRPFVFRRGDPKDGIFFIEIASTNNTVELMFWDGTKLVTRITGLPVNFKIFDADLTYVYGVNQIKQGTLLLGSNIVRIRQDGRAWSVDMNIPLGLFPGSTYTYPGFLNGPSFDRSRAKLAFLANRGGLRPHNDLCSFSYSGIPRQAVTVLNPTAYNGKGNNFKLFSDAPVWINNGNSLVMTYRDAPLTSGRTQIGRIDLSAPSSFKNYSSNASSIHGHLGVSNDGKWLVYSVDNILPFAPNYERVPAMMHWSGGGEILMDVHVNYALPTTVLGFSPERVHMHVAANGTSRIAFAARPGQSTVFHLYGVEPENEIVVRPRLQLGQPSIVEMQNLRSILAFIWVTRQNLSLPAPYVNSLLIGSVAIPVLSSSVPNTRASIVSTIPNNPNLLGVPIYFQGVTQEPGANLVLRLSRLTQAWAVK